MSSRHNRMPRQPWNSMPGRQDGPPLPMLRGQVPGPIAPRPIEVELAMRCDEIQRIIADNCLMMEEIAALRQESTLVKEEIHVLTSQAIPRLHADKELESRDLIQRGLKLEEEMHALESIKAEVLHLTTERQKLKALQEELSAKFQAHSEELKHIQSEKQHIPAMRAELHGLQQQLVRAGAEYEFEKKAHAELLEQRQAMEKDFLNMNREAGKLRTELESRGRRPGNFYPYSFGAY